MRNTDLDREIVALRPQLLAHAKKRTNNLDEANDLVQATILRALEFEHQFERCTNLIAWLIMIQKSVLYGQYHKFGRFRDPRSKSALSFLSLEKAQEKAGSFQLKTIDGYVEPSIEPNQEHHVMVRQIIDEALTSSKHKYEQFVVDSVIAGDYETVAKKYNVPVGTVKSRVNRGRIHLKAKELI